MLKLLNDLKIGTKLLAGFFLVAAMSGLIGWVGLTDMNEMKKRGDSMYADKLVPIRDLSRADASLLLSQSAFRDLLLARNPAEHKTAMELMRTLEQKFDQDWATYKSGHLYKEEQDIVPRFESLLADYRSASKRAVALALEEKDNAALELLHTDMLRPHDEARKNLRALIEVNARLADEDQKANTASTAASTRIILLVIAIGILLAIGMGVFLSRKIGGSLRTIQKSAENMALGDVGCEHHARQQGRIRGFGNRSGR